MGFIPYMVYSMQATLGISFHSFRVFVGKQTSDLTALITATLNLSRTFIEENFKATPESIHKFKTIKNNFVFKRSVDQDYNQSEYSANDIATHRRLSDQDRDVLHDRSSFDVKNDLRLNSKPSHFNYNGNGKKGSSPSDDQGENDWPRRLLITLIAILCLSVAWAWNSQIDRIVRGEGSIVPLDHNQIIQHLEGGIMTALYVREGQIVQAGDVVLRIDDVQAKALLEENLVKQESLRLRAARLMVEAGKANDILLPDGIDENSPAWLAEQASLTMRQSRMKQEELTLQSRLDQRLSELQETQDRLRSAVIERQIASERLQMVLSLRAQKATSQMEVLEAQAADTRLLSVISQTQGALPRIQAAIQEVRSQIAEIQTRAKAEATSELTIVYAELARIEGTIRSQRDRLDRTEVRAPVAGFVNHVNANTLGSVIRPGDTLIEITPSGGELLIEARVRPSDRGELHPGLPAKIKILAYDYMQTPSLTGEIIEVSADTLTTQQGEKFYRVKVKLDEKQAELQGKILYPGLSAQVDIVVGRRSIAAYLLSPLNKFSERAFTEAK